MNAQRIKYHGVLLQGLDASVFWDNHWNLPARVVDKCASLQDLSNASPTALVMRNRPINGEYIDLRGAPAKNFDIARGGGLSASEAEPQLKLGNADGRVPALRSRLGSTGDLSIKN